MFYQRVLTVQDVSCVGQCSLTVALPILSACGLETAILPSAVLSNHTAPEFHGFTFCDLTEEMPKIKAQWQKQNITFDALYTGYLGSGKQVDYVKAILPLVKGKVIVDPAMADNGKLYVGFDGAFVQKMKELCDVADVLLPNITEACLLTGVDYRETYDEAYIENLMKTLSNHGQKVVLTGVSYRAGKTGVAVLDDGKVTYYEHEKFEHGCHGTGDVYASAFVGAYMQGKTLYDAAVIAADYTYDCMKATQGDESHWYGVKFETELGSLIEKLK